MLLFTQMKNNHRLDKFFLYFMQYFFWSGELLSMKSFKYIKIFPVYHRPTYQTLILNKYKNLHKSSIIQKKGIICRCHTTYIYIVVQRLQFKTK